jgi:hypothetical protein
LALTPEQLLWYEQLRRRQRRELLLDPVVRQLDDELKRACANGPREHARERMRPIEDRLGEHLGIGPRPGA